MRIAHYSVAAVALAVFASACSDSSLAPPTNRLSPQAANLVINPVLPGVVVAGADAGAFTNATTPTEATRTAGAFWDNISSDDTPFPGGVKCNVGFYVVGTIGSTCLVETPGSYANRGGFAGGNYWGDNGGIGAGRDASSFMFGGSYQYDVTLKGSYAGGTSEVGWFTHDGSGYHFHAVAGWGSKTLGTTEHINTGGANWGFYIKNGALDATGSCAPQTACSDATGGYTSSPFQQFALFINSAGTALEVGVEDNELSPLWNGPDLINNPENKDSDYNDYILSITPSVIPGGCTYTKGWYRNNGANTITGVDGLTTTVEAAIFAATPGKPGQVTWNFSNDVLNLYQQLLAALENGGANGPAAVKTAITQAQSLTSVSGYAITYTGNQTQLSDLINTLSSFNEGTFAGWPHCGD